MLISKRLKTNFNIVKQININKQSQKAPWQNLPFGRRFVPFCKKTPLVNFNIFQKKTARKLDKRKVFPPFFFDYYSKNNSFLIAKQQPLAKKKSQGGLLLKIVFNSSNPSDIKLCFFLVTKLMNYLNNACSKNLISYSTNLEWKNKIWEGSLGLQTNNIFFFDTVSLVNTFLNFYSTQLTTKPGLDFLLSSRFFYFVQQYNKSKVKKHLVILQKINYFNRYFLKWSEQFANAGSITKQIHKIQTSSKLFTVIRAPFVFKKTREQFSLKKESYFIIVKVQGPIQKRFLTQCLGLLRLPAEFEILDLS